MLVLTQPNKHDLRLKLLPVEKFIFLLLNEKDLNTVKYKCM